jgi:N6-adenosine-specific RNA methylase IME4
MTPALSEVSRKHIVSIPAALNALAAMEHELSKASTYIEIRKIIDQATALKLLARDIDVVKDAAEDVILAASARIGEEIAKVPKGRGPGGVKGSKTAITSQGKSSRKDVMPSGTQRARFQKLAAAKPELKAVVQRLREQGKDATPTAVVRELTQGDKKERRSTREAELGARQLGLPDKKYGVVYADPEWRFEVWSRETGMDRAADNHYPTSATDIIASRDVISITAEDCVLFLWATVPMLLQALEVMRAWGFSYKSQMVWVKDRWGTGYWFRNKHEILLVGTRGDIPAPAPGTQSSSVIEASVGAHSEKPDIVYEIIEHYFPNLPKIELNARRCRLGWDAWGLEAV